MLSHCWRSDITLGKWKFYCHDYYGVLKAAKNAVTKIAVTELWKKGQDIEIPMEVVQMLNLKREEVGRSKLQLAQTANKKQIVRPPPYQLQGPCGTLDKASDVAQTGAPCGPSSQISYRKHAFQNRRSQLQEDPWTKENAIPLGPRRLRELTRDEIMEADKRPDGREPRSFQGLVNSITREPTAKPPSSSVSSLYFLNLC